MVISAINQPGSPSATGTNVVVPYFPQLKQVIQTIPATILFTYLELRFPAPQETLGRLSSLPVTVSVETILDELAISRRTLVIALSAISLVYPSEAKRWAAARSAREFLHARHSRFPRIKFFSVVHDTKTLTFAHVIQIRRNPVHIAQMLANTGLTAIFPSSQATYTPSGAPTQANVTRNTAREDAARQAGAAVHVSSVPGLGENLAQILMKASVLGGDRRRVRYPRLRKAVGSGLEDAGALKVKRSRNTQVTNAVEPVLGVEITNRLMKAKSKVLDHAEGDAEGVARL